VGGCSTVHECTAGHSSRREALCGWDGVIDLFLIQQLVCLLLLLLPVVLSGVVCVILLQVQCRCSSQPAGRTCCAP
jgi:hypothetical protein